MIRLSVSLLVALCVFWPWLVGLARLSWAHFSSALLWSTQADSPGTRAGNLTRNTPLSNCNLQHSSNEEAGSLGLGENLYIKIFVHDERILKKCSCTLYAIVDQSLSNRKRFIFKKSNYHTSLALQEKQKCAHFLFYYSKHLNYRS